MATMIVKCALCGCTIATKSDTAVGGISHGYCKECARVERKRFGLNEEEDDGEGD